MNMILADQKEIWGKKKKKKKVLAPYLCFIFKS